MLFLQYDVSIPSQRNDCLLSTSWMNRVLHFGSLFSEKSQTKTTRGFYSLILLRVENCVKLIEIGFANEPQTRKCDDRISIKHV
jgi:hypothetical protein